MWYRLYKHLKTNKGEQIRQVIVLKTLRKQIIARFGDERTLGYKKTRERIINDFWWPGIQSDVSRLCRLCDVCQKTAPKGTVPLVPLQRMPVIDIPYKRVAVDLVGLIYPPSDSGYRYILTLVDYATRYFEAVALKKVTAEMWRRPSYIFIAMLGFQKSY